MTVEEMNAEDREMILKLEIKRKAITDTRRDKILDLAKLVLRDANFQPNVQRIQAEDLILQQIAHLIQFFQNSINARPTSALVAGGGEGQAA